MKLLRSTKEKINENNGENLPHFEITEVVLVHSNIINNDYQRDSKYTFVGYAILHTFVPNNSFLQLLDIWPKV